MEEKCELLEKCGFFNNFQGSNEVIKEGWIALYCYDLKRSETCLRKKYRKEHGNPPEDNMAPTGNYV